MARGWSRWPESFWSVVAAVALLSGCSAPVAHVLADGPRRGVGVRTAVASSSAGGARTAELALRRHAGQGLGVTDGPTLDPGTTHELPVDRPVTGDRVATAVVSASGYQTVGVTWPVSDSSGQDLAPSIRTRADGAWSDWMPLAVSDAAPDVGTSDAEGTQRSRTGSDSMWIGHVDAIQLSVNTSAADRTPDVRLSVVGSDDSSAGAGAVRAVAAVARAGTVVSALATSVMPGVVTRAQWGAAAPSCTMDVARSLVGAVLHHTADSNAYYSQADAEAMIRNDQRYHMASLGWCDLGYNFVVDKWGTIYEGRAGSLTSSVIGVHTGGFNTGTVGIAMLGTYGSVTPSAAVIRSVAQIIGWKLQPFGVDPTGTMNYYTGAGQNSRYLDQWVTLPTVFGHRDVAYTACPGDQGEAALPAIRELARGSAGPMLISPTISATSIPIGGAETVSAPTVSDINWTLTVVDTRTGITMFSTTGRASESQGGLSATWPGTGPAGAPVGPGQYRVSVTGTDAGTGQPANPFSSVVDVTGSQNPPTVSPVAVTGNLTFVPIAPHRLLDTRSTGQSLGAASRVDLTVAGVSEVPIGARAVALNVTAVAASIPTFVRAWPAGSPAPPSSLVNVAPGRTAAAGGVIAVGGDHRVSLYNDAGSVHLVVDVTGYYTEIPATGTAFAELPRAARLLDTRRDGGIPSGSTRRLVVAGEGGVPADATAVMVNVASVGSDGDGYVSVVPAGADARETSTVNHLPGTDVANRATVPLAGGAVDVHVEGGNANVVVDVVGWYGPSGSLHLTPMTPTRVLDTRSGSPIGPRSTVVFSVAGIVSALPGAKAAVATVTATEQTAPTTFLTLWPAGAPQPPTSDLNTGAGRDQANMAVLSWNGAGQVSAYNNQGSTHFVVDVYGLFG